MMEPLLSIRDCSKTFHNEGHKDISLLEDISFDLYPDEIVGIVGRAGSGKSSLLRIAAGLIPPTAGNIYWKDQALYGPTPHIGIVLQSFALFPWLSVAENVMLGLQAQRFPPPECETRAQRMIDLIGLGGYENAMPHELSKSMLLRASLARSLVMGPEVLLLDEPFADLDVLSAENLRTDLISLWTEKRLPTRSILIVTHNIEEAVLLCDRILLFSSNPGQIEHELEVPFMHPRNRNDLAYQGFVDHIYTILTRRTPIVSEAELPAEESGLRKMEAPPSVVLPAIPVTLLVGLLEAVAAAPFNGRADLPPLATSLQMSLDDLFAIGDSLHLLGLAELEDGDIILTDLGSRFVSCDHDGRKDMIGTSLLHTVPLIRQIRAALDEAPSHVIEKSTFLEAMRETMSSSYAAQTLQTAINWGRYGDLYDFDEETDRFRLIDPD